jgi:hypothetical protein
MTVTATTGAGVPPADLHETVDVIMLGDVGVWMVNVPGASWVRPSRSIGGKNGRH